MTIHQNHVTVRCVDPDGQRLSADLTLYGTVGSAYHVALPELTGYWLTDANAPIDGQIPVGQPMVITLTYTRLGCVRIGQQTLAVTTQSGDPSRIMPLALPALPAGKGYYAVAREHYQLITTPAAFIPTMPTIDTVLAVLTPEAAQRPPLFSEGHSSLTPAQDPLQRDADLAVPWPTFPADEVVEKKDCS